MKLNRSQKYILILIVLAVIVAFTGHMATSNSDGGKVEAVATEVAANDTQKDPTANDSSKDDTVVKDTDKSGDNSKNSKDSSTKNNTTSPKVSDGKGTKDKYKTDTVPAGKPLPVEPQDSSTDKRAQYSCTLSVSCKTILDNMDNLNPEKESQVPEDGIIYKTTTVTFYEGESVFDVLLREMKANKIHMEFTNTPVYNSNYIEGINNLYEFDCGELSGWMYKVNNWFPNYGCSRYQLQDGDVIEWIYTCDLGRDIGGSFGG